MACYSVDQEGGPANHDGRKTFREDGLYGERLASTRLLEALVRSSSSRSHLTPGDVPILIIARLAFGTDAMDCVKCLVDLGVVRLLRMSVNPVAHRIEQAETASTHPSSARIWIGVRMRKPSFVQNLVSACDGNPGRLAWPPPSRKNRARTPRGISSITASGPLRRNAHRERRTPPTSSFAPSRRVTASLAIAATSSGLPHQASTRRHGSAAETTVGRRSGSREISWWSGALRMHEALTGGCPFAGSGPRSTAASRLVRFPATPAMRVYGRARREPCLATDAQTLTEARVAQAACRPRSRICDVRTIPDAGAARHPTCPSPLDMLRGETVVFRDRRTGSSSGQREPVQRQTSGELLRVPRLP
jgi:hypothetical protein